MNKFVKTAMVALVAGVFATSIYAANDSMDNSAADQQAQVAQQDQSAQGQNASGDAQASANSSDPSKATRLAAGKKKCQYGMKKKCNKSGKKCKMVCKKKGDQMSDAQGDNNQAQDASAQQGNTQDNTNNS